jgi:hypothetical protein
METAQEYLERCIQLIQKEKVSETTLIIMFVEYAKLLEKEKVKLKSKDYNRLFYGC